MNVLHVQCTSLLLVMVLIIISCYYVGSVHSMKQKVSDVDDNKKEEDYEEDKKSLGESEEAHF